MSSDNFYDILEIDANSQLEDIRKAYKRRALQTHPDRLPQGSTPEDKRLAEESFRRVNNAYEILSDANKRRLYDLYGTWPPPEELPEVRRTDPFDSYFDRSRARPQHHFTYLFNDPFFQPHASFYPQPFGFRDPFELFNSFFPEFRQDHFGGFPSGGPSPFNGPFFTPMFHHPMGQPSLFMDPFGSHPPMNMFHNFPNDANTRTYSFNSSSSSRNFQGPGSDGNRNWISESTSTRTINGMTETIQRRVDNQGNEHVKKIYHDGHEKYTINGVEQPARGYIPDAPPAGQLPSPRESTGYIPPQQPPQQSPQQSFQQPPQQSFQQPPQQSFQQPPQQPGDTSNSRSKKHWWSRH